VSSFITTSTFAICIMHCPQLEQDTGCAMLGAALHLCQKLVSIVGCDGWSGRRRRFKLAQKEQKYERTQEQG
jgi:hypothetical protein